MEDTNNGSECATRERHAKTHTPIFSGCPSASRVKVSFGRVSLSAPPAWEKRRFRRAEAIVCSASTSATTESHVCPLTGSGRRSSFHAASLALWESTVGITPSTMRCAVA